MPESKTRAYNSRQKSWDFGLSVFCSELSSPSPPETMLVFWRSTCDNGKRLHASQFCMQICPFCNSVCKSATDLSIFYRYFHGHCSMQIKSIIPDPLKHVQPTRNSSQSHPFQVMLSNPRTLSHKSSFIPRTCKLWNTLPPTSFPESYNLSSFKSNINKLDLIPLSS